MTEVQDTADRKAQRMRRIARVLAVMWLGLWTLFVCSTSMFLWMGFPDYSYTLSEKIEQMGLGLSIVEVLLLFTPWIAVPVAWRWESVGGALLLLAGLLLLIGRPVASIEGGLARYHELPGCLFWSLLAAWPAVVAGVLLLASCRKSRRASPTRADEGD